MGDLYTRVSVIVDFGIRAELEELSDSEDEEVVDSAASARVSVENAMKKRLTESWKVLKRIPNFCEHMCSLAQDRRTRNQVCKLLNAARDASRSDDTGTLKKDVISYILLDTKAVITPPIPGVGSKAPRGWSHPQTAALLCPIECDATQVTYDLILSNELCIDADQFPRFLFPDGHSYEADDLSTGILTGHLCFRVAKHIFQGPSTALEHPGHHRGKSGNAALHGITTMTGCSIAYVACQARFAISSAESWNAADFNFDYEKFYWNICRLFDDGEGQDIIDAYNYQIWGTSRPSTECSTVHTHTRPSAFEVLQQQRAAKRARLRNQTSDGRPERDQESQHGRGSQQQSDAPEDA
ncbi:hypothetical protein D9615_010248 [Tricholomella constricta]|uniref:Uncharacterized protein n=1 Tax=Tricholomella constricta TaxID=117010 RepID=A0A8H5GR38_9AGAR|nr:hypothetical protein D9615_010248 [Tricholomella constricta]